MNIAIIAHDKKNELMVQFCMTYCDILAEHTLCATSTTGRLVSEATGLKIKLLMSGLHNGEQQISALVAYNEIDMLFFFRDPTELVSYRYVPEISSLVRQCDLHNVPIATNLACAELLIKSLSRGDLQPRIITRGNIRFE